MGIGDIIVYQIGITNRRQLKSTILDSFQMA
jgi:hypothetical protein